MIHLCLVAALESLLSVIPTAADTSQRDTIATSPEVAIEQVIISAPPSDGSRKAPTQSVSVISQSHINRTMESSLLPTLVERVPSLFVASRSTMGYGISTGAAGGMTLRGVGGSPTSGLLVLVDGTPRQMGLMGHPIADGLLSATAERIEVVRGAASMLHGSAAMGGVINITTRRMKSDGIATEINADYGSYNTLQSALVSRARKQRVEATLAASYNRTDSHRERMGFSSAGGEASLAIDIARAWRMALSGEVLYFDSENPGAVNSPLIDNIAHVLRYATTLSLTNQYGSASGAIHLLFNHGNHNINDGHAPDEEPLDERFHSDDFTVGVALNEEFALWRKAHLTIGGDYRLYGGRTENRNIHTGAVSPIADKQMQQVAAFIAIRQQIARRVELHAGIRHDIMVGVDGEWVPQGGIRIELARGTHLNAVASKGFRYPTIREMYMFPPQNPDLKAERLMNYSVALSHTSKGGKLSIGIELYYIDGDNAIRLERIDNRNIYLNTGEIQNYGIEGEVTWSPLPSLTFTANYSYLHMLHPLVAAPEHKLFCGIDFAKRGWRGSTDVQYIRGLYSSLSPIKREEFVLWNASLAFRACRWCEFYLRGENLLAWRYEINAGYPMPRATFSAGAKLSF